MPDTDEYAAKIGHLTADIGVDDDGDDEVHGGDPTSDDSSAAGEESDHAEASSFTTSTAVEYEPIPPGGSAVGDHTDSRATDESYEETVRKHRPACPTCGFVPTGEDDPLYLTIRECWECSMAVCRECGAECRSCQKPMCDEHKDGHGLEDAPLCSPHAAQVAAQHQHDRELEQRAEARKLFAERQTHEQKRWAHVWTQQKQRGDWEIDRQQKRFDNKITAANLQLDVLKLKAAIRAHQAAQQTQSTRAPFRTHPLPSHFVAIENRLQQFTPANKRYEDQWQTTQTDQTEEPTPATKTRARGRGREPSTQT